MTGSGASVPRTVLRSSARCSSLMTSRTTCTDVTPATADTAWVTRLVIVSRIGQPATVRYTSTRTEPSAPICTSLTMPRSVSGRLISGSWTVARAALTASSAGVPVSVSVIGACVSFDGDPGPAVGLRTAGPARSGHLPLYGGWPRMPPGAECSAAHDCSEGLRPTTAPLGTDRAGGRPGRTMPGGAPQDERPRHD